MSTQKYPDEFEDLDFEIIEENWNEYDLDELDSAIKGRLVLRKIISDPHNPQFVAFDFAPVILSVSAPVASRGEKNNQPKPDDYSKLPSYEVRIKNSNEKYNRYRILKNDTIVKVRLIISEVTRIKDRFDDNGLPFYIMNYSYDIPQVKPGSKNPLLP